ncbi:radical SAM protein [Acetobacterium wieringae]|uniref:radical SAM/SPASM domain-containing protein n=1 Tax=Acetobacterium wieringae TaxID=52694 RepID=UPI0026EFA42D|nr:radical SAM protein [Acetobacterium wieringae]
MKTDTKQFGSIEKIQLEHWNKINHPFNGGFEITSKCNFNCVHCYLKGMKSSTDLTTDEIKQIIDKMYYRGVLFLYFTGGEIFLRKDFIEIYKYAKNKGFILSLLTNGSLLNKQLIETFRLLPPALVSISIYGANEKTYNDVTKSAGQFDKVINNLRLLRRNNINFEIKFIAMKENYREFKEIESLAQELNVKFSFTFELFPTLKGDIEVLEHSINTEDIINLEKNIEIATTVWSLNICDTNPLEKLENVPLYTCSIGKSNFVIDSEGFLNPCNKIRINKFNLKVCGFDDGWNDFSTYSSIQASKDYKCRSCKNISICNPCPALNKLSTGEYEKPPKSVCDLTKARAKEFSKNKYDYIRKNYKNPSTNPF